MADIAAAEVSPKAEPSDRSAGDALAAFSPACERLARSAAYAAGCPFGLLYLRSAIGVSTLMSHEAGIVPTPALETACASATVQEWPGHGLLMAGDGDEHGDGFPLLFNIAAAIGTALRFIAAYPIERSDGQRCGILIVADTALHAGLSAAQSYLLASHAAHAATCLDTEALQKARLASTVTERLRLLESVVVHANDAVLITEAEPVARPGPRIVYCNAAFTKTTGYTEQEVLGKTPRILQHPDTNRVSLGRLRRALERWEPVEVELLNVRKNGTPFWVELSIVPVADEAGRFTHWVSVQRDVSHRKEAEEVATRARLAELENRLLEGEISKRKQSEERLRYAASHDSLTGLYNRAYFMDRLAAVLSGAGTRGTAPECAVLFLDLDGFKLVNDSLSHRAGDLLLMEVARRLQSCIRPGDTLARVGGDEFAMMVEDIPDIAAGVTVAERIVEVLREPITLGQDEVFTSTSIGIAQAASHHAGPEELLRDADIAMYQTKKRGNGNYALFDISMHTGAVEAMALQTDLRHAIARNEFVLHYQPIFDTKTSSVAGLEALIRWDHPQRGLVPPASFIPLAEDIGLIREIDRWVLREACTQMRRWAADGLAPGLRVSVNVSAHELRDSAFIAELCNVLEVTGLEPRRLQIEITEGVFLREPEAIERVLAEVRAMGVRIALDDFGTGYSSLGYLDRYEIDTLKIDRTFVARMLGQSRAMAILQSILQLAGALSLDVVAEGVETEAQLATLRAMRCGQVQGYLLSKPLPAADMALLLQGGNA